MKRWGYWIQRKRHADAGERGGDHVYRFMGSTMTKEAAENMVKNDPRPKYVRAYHVPDYNPLKAFNARKPVDLKDLRSADTAYLDELENMLKKESKERGEECVIGVWNMRFGMEFRNEGFGLYTRSEADELKEHTRLYGLTAPYFADYVSKEDLEKIKGKRFKSHRPSPTAY